MNANNLLVIYFICDINMTSVVTLFFSRIAHQYIAHVTKLNCHDSPLQIS